MSLTITNGYPLTLAEQRLQQRALRGAQQIQWTPELAATAKTYATRGALVGALLSLRAVPRGMGATATLAAFGAAIGFAAAVITSGQKIVMAAPVQRVTFSV